ncbi:glutamate--cysteine ligase [Salinilacihabitans rarus]|uniref:glutamate--cysteine ligase n=1 Tax=Salinilacihabitans rarus TaxID=2961596 RepID=UPI0020C8B4E9|nr:glutamate--cysteine ligase [Salinilacihabitans rarus]
MKTSLEVEYWVVDDDGDLVSADPLLDVSEQVDPEFVEPMIEIKTTPCESASELRADLLGRLGRVVDRAREHDRRLVPLATPLSAAPSELPYRESESTALQRRILGPAFGDARFCAGTHVHLERSNVVDQLNALTALDPAFALVASAAHHRGERLLACARPYLYRRSCYGGFPEQGQLWSYVDSVAEWDARLREAFDRFRETALARGVDESAFDREYDPYEAVWTPVRLREAVPTVEWRSPDAALPSQLLELAGQVRAVVARAEARGTVVDPGGDGTDDDGRVGLPAFETVERTVDAAIRDGAADPAVCRYLERLGLDPSRFDPLGDRLPDGRLSRRRARRLRLRAAGWLEADLERTAVRA